jgi:hypothetical protein
MKEFHPHLEILPPAQARLWRELSTLPDQFVLYGGTALALHLGHRNSVDFDFFARAPLNLSQLEGEIPFLAGAKIIQREKNTLSVIVERGDPVKVSFFGVPKLPQLEPAYVVEENNLKVASLLDLAGTKASVIQVRAEAKDYLDLDALMRLGEVDLATALSAAHALYGQTFNPDTAYSGYCAADHLVRASGSCARRSNSLHDVCHDLRSPRRHAGYPPLRFR